MAGKIKLTKTELKAQTDALRRFERFLPMLQLKKQQLQAEIAVIDAHVEEVTLQERELLTELSSWIALFSTDRDSLEQLISFKSVRATSSNIAGVAIPVYDGIETVVREVDLFATPAWFDDAIDSIRNAWSLRAERAVLQEQRTLVERELQTTSQRVNLFEKVKIPECKENIRVIRIAIGDEQTAAVMRGKIAKSRSSRRESEESA